MASLEQRGNQYGQETMQEYEKYKEEFLAWEDSRDAK